MCICAKTEQASLHVYKCTCCHTHALNVTANNGCQLGSRWSKEHKWIQVHCFFLFFFWLAWGKEEKITTKKWARKNTDLRVDKRCIEGWKALTLWQRKATSKTAITSHTSHLGADRSSSYCTLKSQENDKNQHWTCLCWGKTIKPYFLSWSALFLPLLPFTIPLVFIFIL